MKKLAGLLVLIVISLLSIGCNVNKEKELERFFNATSSNMILKTQRSE